MLVAILGGFAKLFGKAGAIVSGLTHEGLDCKHRDEVGYCFGVFLFQVIIQEIYPSHPHQAKSLMTQLLHYYELDSISQQPIAPCCSYGEQLMLN